MTTEETRLAELLRAPAISPALFRGIREDPRRRSAVLAKRMQALFSLSGIRPDAAGYRRLLFAVLSSEALARQLTGLRLPKTSTKTAVVEARQPPGYMVTPLRTVASLTAQGFSKAIAIRRAVEEQNGMADHLDLCSPQSSPRKKITIHSLKKEEQRTRLRAKSLPDAVDDVAFEAELDRKCHAAALEASAPRSDRWVDELSNLLGAHRQGKIDRVACRRRMMAALDAELGRCAGEQAPTAT